MDSVVTQDLLPETERVSHSDLAAEFGLKPGAGADYDEKQPRAELLETVLDRDLPRYREGLDRLSQ